MFKRQTPPAPPSENRLLACLPPDDSARILRRTEIVPYGLKDVIYRANGALDYAYFPRSGVLSAVLIMMDGRAAEVETVGNEGMIGLTALFGQTVSPTEVFCQIPGDARRMPVAAFLEESQRAGRFQDIVRRYTLATMGAAIRFVACNCLHGVRERCARWILMTRDRVGGDEFPLTQEFLSFMLGVRRASVTLAARAIQKAGLVVYRHGRMKVLDAEGLEEASCECYRAIRAEFERPLS